MSIVKRKCNTAAAHKIHERECEYVKPLYIIYEFLRKVDRGVKSDCLEKKKNLFIVADVYIYMHKCIRHGLLLSDIGLNYSQILSTDVNTMQN